MNATLKSVVMTAAGVILAGVLLYYGGNLPVLADARKGMNGSAK